MTSRAVAGVVSLLFACGPSAKEPAPPPNEPARATLATNDLGDAEAQLQERIRKVVLGERARLRACYEEGLAKNPSLAGRVVLVVDVGQNGMASKVFEAKRDGLGDAEVHCFANVLKAAHFHDGAASTVRIQVPLAFAQHE